MTTAPRWGGVSHLRGYGQSEPFASAEMTRQRRLSEKYDTGRPRSETGRGRWRVLARPVDPLFSLRALRRAIRC